MNFEKMAENEFKGLDRATLRNACKEAGLTIGGNESDESMQRKLCAAFGVAVPEAKEEQKATNVTPIKKPTTGRPPNLDPDGVWEGRMVKLTIRCTDPHVKTCPVGWNRMYRNLPLNTEVVIPEPLYNNLKTRVIGIITQKPERDENNLLIGYRKEVTESRLYIIENASVTPETAHLFGDYLEYFQHAARKTENFAKVPREGLVFIHSKLLDHVNLDALRELSDDAIRTNILRSLGPEFDASTSAWFEEAV